MSPNPALIEAVLSVLRSVLIAVGATMVSRGYLSDESVNAIVGSLLVMLPLFWGVFQKYRAEREAAAREALALNVGIVVADNTIGATPPVAAVNVPETIIDNSDAVLMPVNPEVSPLIVTNLTGAPS